MNLEELEGVCFVSTGFSFRFGLSVFPSSLLRLLFSAMVFPSYTSPFPCCLPSLVYSCEGAFVWCRLVKSKI